MSPSEYVVVNDSYLLPYQILDQYLWNRLAMSQLVCKKRGLHLSIQRHLVSQNSLCCQQIKQKNNDGWFCFF